MKYLIIDGLNFGHRARAGFQAGPAPILFNFFRNLRALVEMHKPDRIYYVLEGHPKERLAEMPEYKGNRDVADDDPLRDAKIAESAKFHADYKEAVTLLMTAFPVTVVRHPDHEADDVINLLAETFLDDDGRAAGDEVVIVSSDSDFIQTIQNVPGAKLYNSIKKTFVEAPDYDYLTWKCLRGDATDNIPGIPGCGDKTAAKIAKAITVEPTLFTLLKYLQDRPGADERYMQNLRLISFKTLCEDDLEDLETVVGTADWARVKEVFDSHGFKSITNDKSWKKFTDTFDAAGKHQ